MPSITHILKKEELGSIYKMREETLFTCAVIGDKLCDRKINSVTPCCAGATRYSIQKNEARGVVGFL